MEVFMDKLNPTPFQATSKTHHDYEVAAYMLDNDNMELEGFTCSTTVS